MTVPPGLEIVGPVPPARTAILSDEALALAARLQRELGPRCAELLAARAERQARLDAGESLGYLAETRAIREGDWTVAPAPPALQDRRVEITGPAEPKMMINALNSGARVFMCDLEDALSPTWANVLDGQQALRDAVRHELEFASPEGKEYRLNDEIATLIVRPRGWHLDERHVTLNGEPLSGGLFDLALHLTHNAHELVARGSGPFLYLPKLESHLEARIWNDAFVFAQKSLEIPRGTIKATVLIETLPATFELNEILWELRDHSAGLNCGRWDYIFSFI
ncbi:MAG: malate synthase, partial [Actinomycetota bacterium]